MIDAPVGWGVALNDILYKVFKWIVKYQNKEKYCIKRLSVEQRSHSSRCGGGTKAAVFSEGREKLSKNFTRPCQDLAMEGDFNAIYKGFHVSQCNKFCSLAFEGGKRRHGKFFGEQEQKPRAETC